MRRISWPASWHLPAHWRTALAQRQHQLWTQPAQQAQTWWQARAPRERTMLALGGGLCLLALLWRLGLAPALEQIRQHRQQLMVLQADAARLSALVREAQVLQRNLGGAIEDAAMMTAIEDSLARAGLQDTARLTAEPDAATWRVELSHTHAGMLLPWLAHTPALLRLRPQQITLTRARSGQRDLPGRVDGHIVLSRTAPEDTP